IDILVNNAGIQIRGNLENFDLLDWQRLIDVNLTGAFLVSKAVVKDMIEKKSGKIINICSIQSELARPSIAPYTASKGGLKNLTKGMATDWGKYNIQVNGIAPGYFKTEMTKALYNDEKFDSWLCSRTPANRWGEPEELIGSLIFLASNASSYVNGHLVYVDGGMLACV
ncbi:MAG: SDR family oxidoreductase, partial [Chlorobi bacterium]|nr:SDR family oxidoreductase [Chlorobiota bacterium]